MHESSRNKEHAFTLIELILVVTIFVTGFTLLMPNFNAQSVAAVSDKLNRFSTDIRSAFDLAVLNNKAYRLAFHINSGRYWLEEANISNFYLGSGEREGDLSPEGEKEKREEFDLEFEKYMSLAGETYKDPEKDEEIPPNSPVLSAKKQLQYPVWMKVDSIEWGDRFFSPQLIIREMKAEHHVEKVTFEGRDPDENFAYLYFLPKGYVEKAYFHLYYLQGDAIDESREPWTIKTHPHRGEAILMSGKEDIDLERYDDEE